LQPGASSLLACLLDRAGALLGGEVEPLEAVVELDLLLGVGGDEPAVDDGAGVLEV
jgi:hypothetical protein